MAGFADDASPALPRIERPVIGGQSARIDVHGEAAGAGLGGERGAEADGKRREAAIEADGEDGRRSAGDGHGGIEIGLRQCERLLDPDGLTGSEGGTGEFAMLIMTGRDEDLRQPRVIEQRGHIGGRGRGGTGEELRGKSIGGSEGRRRRGLATQLRHEDAGSEVAAADDADAAGGTAIPIPSG